MTTHFTRHRLILLLLIAIAAFVALLPGPSRAEDLQTAINRTSAAGGGVVSLAPRQRVVVAQGIIVEPGVTLDLNGGELVARLTDSNAAGVRLLSRATLRNGTVTVQSLGQPGAQAGAHAGILVGALYGENASPTRLSRFESPTGWAIRNVTVQTDKLVSADGLMLGGAAIQVMGGASGGVIEGVTVPDSNRMAGGILLDWSTVGAISSSDVTGSAVTFRAGRGYTTHPHDITIRDITIGRLTRPSRAEYGSFGVRLSGTYDISVSDVAIAAVTEAGFRYTAGDLGFEFARSADRARAHMGISVNGLRVASAGAYLVRTDSFADNVARAAEAGYRPALAPIAPTDMTIANVTGGAGGGAGPGYGLRVDHQRGGTFADIAATGFRRGFYIDEQVYGVRLVRPRAADSGEAGISVEHPYRPPSEVVIENPNVSGRSAAARTIIVGTSQAVTVSNPGAAVMRVAREARGAIVR